MTPHGTKFSKHERTIRLGNKQALAGWWDAAIECRDLFDGNAKQYGTTAGRVAKDWKANTIRVYVGRLIKLMETGHKLSEFKSLEHAWETLGYYSNKSKTAKPEPTGKRTINASTRKAYDALMSTAEFRALPAHEKALIRKLAKGESFHTNIG